MDCLDEDDELCPEVVRRLRYYGSALLDGSISLAAVAEDWADWFDPTCVFVAAYAPEGVEELEEAAPLMANEVEEDTVLTAPDRAYLTALELKLACTPRCGCGSSPTRGERLVHGVCHVRVRGAGSGSWWRCWNAP